MNELALSKAYLASPQARESLAEDPYWPKWDSPWWHACLLGELGLARDIPLAGAEALLEAIAAHYVDFFPNPREALPAGKDQFRHALCHCALGSIYRVLRERGLDVDARLPWARTWFLRYQLPDGGLNCEDKAYAAGGASSIQSTLPVLEALLYGVARDRTPAENAALDRGAAYLIERRLAFRRCDGRPMDEAFLKVAFPRFCDYDVLRGLAFLADWARERGGRVPDEAVAPAMRALEARFPDGVVRVERPGLDGIGTLRLADGEWRREPRAALFPLLEACRRPGAEVEALSRDWARVRAAFAGR